MSASPKQERRKAARLKVAIPIELHDNRGFSLHATYDLSATRVDTVSDTRVRQVTLQRPLFPTGRQDGVWSQIVPSYTRTELTLNVPARKQRETNGGGGTGGLRLRSSAAR